MDFLCPFDKWAYRSGIAFFTLDTVFSIIVTWNDINIATEAFLFFDTMVPVCLFLLPYLYFYI